MSFSCRKESHHLIVAFFVVLCEREPWRLGQELVASTAFGKSGSFGRILTFSVGLQL